MKNKHIIYVVWKNLCLLVKNKRSNFNKFVPRTQIFQWISNMPLLIQSLCNVIDRAKSQPTDFSLCYIFICHKKYLDEYESLSLGNVFFCVMLNEMLVYPIVVGMFDKLINLSETLWATFVTVESTVLTMYGVQHRAYTILHLYNVITLNLLSVQWNGER